MHLIIWVYSQYKKKKFLQISQFKKETKNPTLWGTPEQPLNIQKRQTHTF